MTPNKTRDALAEEFCFEKREYNPRSAGAACYMEGFEDGFDAAEKQYLGYLKISESKVDEWGNKHFEAIKQIESLKADLASAVETLKKITAYNKDDGYPPKDNKGPSSMAYWRWQELISRELAEKTLSTLKTKLGGK
jgi:hypothetical protein